MNMKDLYDKEIKRKDKLGYAETFKQCTETLFEEIRNYFDVDSIDIHIEDVEYLDGYFIFGSGTNSVIHFHVKECPGWKFGIWWNLPEKKKKKKDDRSITGTFFAQYEDTIDKFKPSASNISEKVTVCFDGYCPNYRVSEAINFIKNEPYLAFCRDYFDWDYNVEYHSREEAEEEYHSYYTRKANEVHYETLLNNKILDFVKEKILPEFNGAKIDDVENRYPRYEIQVPLELNLDYAELPGWYNLDMDGELEKEFNDLISECEKIAEENDIWWSLPIHRTIYLYDKGNENE